MGNTNSSSIPSLSETNDSQQLTITQHHDGINRTVDNNIKENQCDHKVDLSTPMKADNDSLEPLPYIDNNVDLLDTLCNLPSELKQLGECSKIIEELVNERKHIIYKLREIACYLEKMHSDVLIADRVGTGVAITSGLLTLGGIVAAPFTAGISLGLTIAGMSSGVAGGVTSAGANFTGYILLKKALSLLKTELEEHHVKMETFHEDLMKDSSSYLRKAIRLRPTLTQLGQLSQKGFVEFISVLHNLISLALKGNYAQINKIVNHHVDPTLKDILSYFKFDYLDPETLHALAQLLTLISSQIQIIFEAVKSFVNHLDCPELAAKAMMFASLSTATAKTTKTIANDAAEVSAAFKGTPLAMSKTARYMTGAFTAAFIVIDIIHMTRICQETGNTPTVQELRKLADQLENDLQLPK